MYDTLVGFFFRGCLAFMEAKNVHAQTRDGRGGSRLVQQPRPDHRAPLAALPTVVYRKVSWGSAYFRGCPGIAG